MFDQQLNPAAMLRARESSLHFPNIATIRKLTKILFKRNNKKIIGIVGACLEDRNPKITDDSRAFEKHGMQTTCDVHHRN